MKYHLTPDEGTLETNIIERTIGRAVSVEPMTEPFGPASRDLLGDVFHALYNSDMNPLEDKDVNTTRKVNHALMKWMNRDEEFMATREKTKGKLAHSLISSKILYEYLITDEAIRKALEVQEEPPPDPQGGQGGGGGESHEDKIDKAINGIKKLSDNVVGSQIMSLGAQKAEQAADKTDQAMKAWGIEPGDVNISNIEDIMKVVDGHDSKMKEISDLAGRFESVVAKALEKTRESFIGQVVDVHRTKEFDQMYGTEMCYLTSPDVPPLIHTKYVTDYIEAGLLGVEVRSEAKEFGSLYMMVDGSGSMSGILEVYAKAVAIGLAKAMNRDTFNNRIYSLNTFSSRSDNFFTVTSDEDWNAHFKWAAYFQGGGTDFDIAFARSMRDIAKMPEGTDLVFITDGDCRLSDEMVRRWKEFRSQTGTRLLYVDVSNRMNSELMELCDMYLKVDVGTGNMDFIADGIASKLAENMETSRLKKHDADGD